MGISDTTPETLKHHLLENEESRLAPGAARSRDGIRRSPEPRLAQDYRPAYAIDADRILHSLAYSRYIDKTQVFSLIRNDHITHRLLHVQFVSKIGRTIGRALGLNEDLIEAIAIGHDIGHPPFGHDGETYLDKICMAHGIGHFCHNVQSVRFLSGVERKGDGWNLTLQTLDGLLSHNGEVHDRSLTPKREKTFADLDAEIAAQTGGKEIEMVPMTLEGCLVRIVDTVSYIGRDIEDAIRLGFLDRNDLPKSCTDLLGRTNGTIIYNLVTDIIRNSIGRERIAYSEAVSTAIYDLKRFNLKSIYLNPSAKTHLAGVEDLFCGLFEKYLTDLEKGNDSSVIITRFLNTMSEAYKAGSSNPEIVRDFIAGMTDSYFLEQFPEEKRPNVIIL